MASAEQADKAPPTVLPVESHRKLGPGQCEDCFDCVDTVGFPPTGQRWACVDGKCIRAKLPSLVTDGSSAESEMSADNHVPSTSPRKASKRRH